MRKNDKTIFPGNEGGKGRVQRRGSKELFGDRSTWKISVEGV